MKGEGICILKTIIDIFNNHIIVAGIISWFVAQVLKFILYYIIHKEIHFERIIGAGGMPSSHSALVCSVCVSVYNRCGADSAVFALSLVLAGIVMYDAMGVRRAAGEHAKVINKVIIYPMKNKDNNKENIEKINENSFETIAMKTLKELLGHTPLEVFSGAILGIIIGIILK